MSGFGPAAQWLRNIEADRQIEIVLGASRVAASWRRLGVDEAAAVIARYERRSRFMAGLVRAVLSQLLGWRYDGSAEHRRAAAAQLPLVAFRPFLAGSAGRR